MRGGKREGAGRPAISAWAPMAKVTVRLPVEYVTWAREEGAGNVSDGLRRLLEELDQLRGTPEAVKGA